MEDLNDPPRPPDGDPRPPTEDALKWVDERVHPDIQSAEQLYRSQLSKKARLDAISDDSLWRERKLEIPYEVAAYVACPGELTFTNDSSLIERYYRWENVQVLFDHELEWRGPDYNTETEWDSGPLGQLVIARSTNHDIECMVMFPPLIPKLLHLLEKYPGWNAIEQGDMDQVIDTVVCRDIIETLRRDEQRRRNEIESEAGLALERARAAWWRWENPLPLLHITDESSRDDQHITDELSINEQYKEVTPSFRKERLMSDRDYTLAQVATKVHEGVSAAEAFRQLEKEAGGDDKLCFTSEKAIYSALEQRGVSVADLKSRGRVAIERK